MGLSVAWGVECGGCTEETGGMWAVRGLEAMGTLYFPRNVYFCIYTLHSFCFNFYLLCCGNLKEKGAHTHTHTHLFFN